MPSVFHLRQWAHQNSSLPHIIIVGDHQDTTTMAFIFPITDLSLSLCFSLLLARWSWGTTNFSGTSTGTSPISLSPLYCCPHHFRTKWVRSGHRHTFSGVALAKTMKATLFLLSSNFCHCHYCFVVVTILFLIFIIFLNVMLWNLQIWPELVILQWNSTKMDKAQLLSLSFVNLMTALFFFFHSIFLLWFNIWFYDFLYFGYLFQSYYYLISALMFLLYFGYFVMLIAILYLLSWFCSDLAILAMDVLLL